MVLCLCMRPRNSSVCSTSPPKCMRLLFIHIAAAGYCTVLILELWMACRWPLRSTPYHVWIFFWKYCLLSPNFFSHSINQFDFFHCQFRLASFFYVRPGTLFSLRYWNHVLFEFYWRYLCNISRLDGRKITCDDNLQLFMALMIQTVLILAFDFCYLNMAKPRMMGNYLERQQVTLFLLSQWGSQLVGTC